MSSSQAESERVLIVEDDRGLSQLLVDEMKDNGYAVRAAHSVSEAAGVVEEWLPDVVVSDLRLPGKGGHELLSYVRSLKVQPAFIVITAFGSVPEAVQSLKAGADNFLTKPLDLDHLRVSLRKAIDYQRLKREIIEFRELLGKEHFHGIIGQSHCMQELFTHIRQLGQSRGPVLLVGESGSGKELVARAIHKESMPAGAPFIPVNCAGIPEGLLESEFFGHSAGAFTGAGGARKGLFVEAEGGTLLLDEIAEMPPNMQTKLLRVLDDGIVRAVGSNSERHVSVRIIAATNRDLELEVREGRFREDLLFRLETFRLEVPPLRERQDDLELLAARFIGQFSRQLGKDLDGINEAALEQLRSYSFPGNVRELKNAVEYAVAVCSGREIELADLPKRILGGRPAATARDEGKLESLIPQGSLPTLADLERKYIDYVLQHTSGNKRKAAAVLGMSRRTLYRKLEEE